MTTTVLKEIIDGAIPFFADASSNMSIRALNFARIGQRDYIDINNINTILQAYIDSLSQAQWYIESTGDEPTFNTLALIEQANEITESILGVDYQWSYT